MIEILRFLSNDESADTLLFVSVANFQTDFKNLL